MSGLGLLEVGREDGNMLYRVCRGNSVKSLGLGWNMLYIGIL